MSTVPYSPAELAHLLGRTVRAAVGPDERAALAGRRVVVTGAAGSIGSELAREVAACEPLALAVVDHHELGLFNLERELRRQYPDLDLRPYLCDVAHGPSIRRATRDVRPDVVYHAAAYKHVTMAERAPSAAARVNVLGSVAAAEAAAAVGARFVLISSDKAADPLSVMGATKRLAEMAVLARASRGFRPIVVRFGNVLGSSGSFLPMMREAIRRGDPVRLTDPDATRYFMTAGEAVALVLRADALARTAEIFWLDMGEAVRLADLTERLVALERSAGYPATAIEIIGLRPGEKRNETLTDASLIFQRTIDHRILVAREARPAPLMDQILARLRSGISHGSDTAVLDVLSTAIPGFSPSRQARDAAAGGARGASHGGQNQKARAA